MYGDIVQTRSVTAMPMLMPTGSIPNITCPHSLWSGYTIMTIRLILQNIKAKTKETKLKQIQLPLFTCKCCCPLFICCWPCSWTWPWPWPLPGASSWRHWAILFLTYSSVETSESCIPRPFLIDLASLEVADTLLLLLSGCPVITNKLL